MGGISLAKHNGLVAKTLPGPTFIADSYYPLRETDFL
jgi:hypothetical protein